MRSAKSGEYRFAFKVAFAASIGVAMYLMVHAIIFPFLWAPIAAAIAWRGRWEERVVATTTSVNLMISAVAPALQLFPHLYETDQPRLGVLFVDFASLLVLLIVAIRSGRWWPSWAAAFELMMVLSHVIFMTAGDYIQPWAYVSSVVIWTWLKHVLLAFIAFDICVEPYRDGNPRAVGVLLQLFILLAFLPFMEPSAGWSGAYVAAQGAWLAVTLVVFTVWHGRAISRYRGSLQIR